MTRLNSVKQPLVFIKTHKVGGTSLRLLLERNVNELGGKILIPFGSGKGSELKAYRRHRFDEVLGEDYVAEEVFSDFDAPYDFSGSHLPYDEKFFDYMLPGARFVTFVRDPLERAVSHFYYHGGEDFNAWFMANCDQASLRFAPDNTRVINYFSWWLGLESEQTITPELLRDRFLFIGIQESFAESVAVLGRLLQWPVRNMTYSYERHNSNKPTRQLSEEVIIRFRELNGRDYALYAIARDLLRQALNRFLPELEADVTFLQRNILPSRPGI
jgi:hypothetical protein